MSDERYKGFIETMKNDIATVKADIATLKNGANKSVQSVIKVIDDATFSTTVTGEEIDFKNYRNFMVTARVGAIARESPTLIAKLQFKGASGNWVDDPDYVGATISTASTSQISFKGYMESYSAVWFCGG